MSDEATGAPSVSVVAPAPTENSPVSPAPATTAPEEIPATIPEEQQHKKEEDDLFVATLRKEKEEQEEREAVLRQELTAREDEIKGLKLTNEDVARQSEATRKLLDTNREEISKLEAQMGDLKNLHESHNESVSDARAAALQEQLSATNDSLNKILTEKNALERQKARLEELATQSQLEQSTKQIVSQHEKSRLAELLARNSELSAVIESQQGHLQHLSEHTEQRLCALKAEHDRSLLHVEQQLAEARERCVLLQEKLNNNKTPPPSSSKLAVTTPEISSNNSSFGGGVVADQVILPEGVARRLFTKLPLTSCRSKYGVEIDLQRTASGQHAIVLNGPRMNVLVLKNEILQIVALGGTPTGGTVATATMTQAMLNDVNTARKNAHRDAQETVSSLHLAVQLANERVTRAENELEDCKVELAHRTAERDDARRDVDTRIAQQSRYQQNYDQMKHDLSLTQQRLQDELDAERLRVQRTKQQLTECEAQVTTLRHEKESTERVLYAAQEEVRLLREINDRLTDGQKEAAARERSATAAGVEKELRAQLEHMRQAHRAEMQSVAAEKGRLMEKLTAETAASASMKVELKQLREQNAHWEQERRVAQHLVSELSARAARGDEESLAKVYDERDQFSAEKKQLDFELQSTRLELKSARNDIATLSRTLRDTKRELDEYKGMIIRMTNERELHFKAQQEYEISAMRQHAETQGELMQTRLLLERSQEEARYLRNRADQLLLKHRPTSSDIPMIEGGAASPSPVRLGTPSSVARKEDVVVQSINMTNSSNMIDITTSPVPRRE